MRPTSRGFSGHTPARGNRVPSAVMALMPLVLGRSSCLPRNRTHQWSRAYLCNQISAQRILRSRRQTFPLSNSSRAGPRGCDCFSCWGVAAVVLVSAFFFCRPLALLTWTLHKAREGSGRSVLSELNKLETLKHLRVRAAYSSSALSMGWGPLALSRRAAGGRAAANYRSGLTIGRARQDERAQCAMCGGRWWTQRERE